MAASNVVKSARVKKPRAVSPASGTDHRVAWPYFERVNATRLKLKPEPGRTLYALLHLLADEHDAQRMTLTARGVEMSPADVGAGLFAKHAASAFRMAADRLLKSFTLTDVIRAERYGMEEWSAAVARMNRPSTPSPS